MKVVEIPVDAIDVSQSNVRKDLGDGEFDGGIYELANSIERQTLLNPITVYKGSGDRYTLVAGQRRLLAIKRLGWLTISAIVRDHMSDSQATVVSLVENVHRADMNPRDKAIAFKKLLSALGHYQAVYKETGISVPTIKKYVQLLDLAPELQEKLAAGEATATAALARLAQIVKDPETQIDVFERIGGFTQDVQNAILKNVDADLGNLDELVEKAHEGTFDIKLVRQCPRDCPNIPPALKPQVEALIKTYRAGSRTN